MTTEARKLFCVIGFSSHPTKYRNVANSMPRQVVKSTAKLSNKPDRGATVRSRQPALSSTHEQVGAAEHQD